MKTTILTFAIVLTSFSLTTASVNPTEAVKLLETTTVMVTLENAADADFFKVANYDTNQDILEFVTESKMSYIQIFDAKGSLDFQLPVMSNKVKISKALFDQGNYKLGFLIQGKEDVKFTNVTIR